MDLIKRILGIVWVISGPGLLVYLVSEAIKINSLPDSSANELLQWGIIIGIFIPIVLGFMIFGYYSLKGEYNLKQPK